MLSKFIHIGAGVNASFLFLSNTPLYGQTAFVYHLPMDILVLLLLGSFELCCYEHSCASFCVDMFSILLDMYLGGGKAGS